MTATSHPRPAVHSLAAAVGIGALALVGAAAAAGHPASSATRPIVVRLGVHRFGHTRPPDAVVAHATADRVGWLHEGVSAGPETFVVDRDRSIWLHDEVNHRLLVWRAGDANTVAIAAQHAAIANRSIETVMSSHHISGARQPS
jgi:hypothetical protein